MRTFIFLSLLSLAALATRAQQNSKTDNLVGSGNTAASADGITLRGCIMANEKDTFIQEGTGAMFRLVGKHSQFATYRGKLSELTVKELPRGQR